MAKIKGIDLVNLRTYFRKRPPAEEKCLLKKLSEEQKLLYLATLTANWNPIEIQDSIYQQASDILFPQDPDKYTTLGKKLSEMTYTGIYKVFFKILTPEAMAKSWVKLWPLYHDTGKPIFKAMGAGHFQVSVKNHPGLPVVTRQLITGHIMKIIELIGKKRFMVHHIENDPENWVWDILLQD